MAIDDSRTNSVVLGLGDYILEEGYTVFADGLNAGLSAEFDASLVPIPEPRGAISIVAGALLVIASLKRIRTRSMNNSE